MHTPTDLIETYLTGVTANLGYPVGMGMPANPDTVRKWAVDIAKLAGTEELVAALRELLAASDAGAAKDGDSVACMLRYVKADEQARAALAKVRP